MKERDSSIDILKFIAVLLIINSHADIMYPRMQILATGGAIGDCLFLFCSGFTLFWGKQKSFGNYYKRRINRIYPSVFAAVAFTHIYGGRGQLDYMQFAGGEFVIAIMIYYMILYYVRKYASDRIPIVLLMVAIVSMVVYIFWFPYKYETGSLGLYGTTTYYRWIPYFAAMLLGAYVGVKRYELNYNSKRDFIILILCLGIFYSIQFASKKYQSIAPLQIVTLLPLMGITVYLYKCCNCEWIKNLYGNKKGNIVIMTVGGLCLESYLIQGDLFTDKMNSIWPLNLVIIVLFILLCSYAVRCIARLFAQTFRTEDYEWKKIFSLY